MMPMDGLLFFIGVSLLRKAREKDIYFIAACNVVCKLAMIVAGYAPLRSAHGTARAEPLTSAICFVSFRLCTLVAVNMYEMVEYAL